MGFGSKRSLWWRRLSSCSIGSALLAVMFFCAGCQVALNPNTECLVNADCDDGVFCNGLEYCSIETAEAMRCFSRENPCNNPVGCNEETDQCELD